MMIGVDARGRIAAFEDRPTSAAHSMDTDWYAVDCAGRVSMLSSGEEGAVPIEAHRQYWSELYDDLVAVRVASVANASSEREALLEVLDGAESVERGLVAAILDGDNRARVVYADWLEERGRERWIAPTPPAEVFIVDEVLRPISARALPARWDGILRFANETYLDMFRTEFFHPDFRVLDEGLGMANAVAASGIQKYAFDDYWAAGAILCAYVTRPPVRPRAIGLYEYACAFAGPYIREGVPRVPLLVNELPAALRARVGGLRLSQLSFAGTTEFDPSAFVDCHLWRQ